MAASTDKHCHDDALIALLVAGRTSTEAAAALGMSVSTVYGRLRNPLFRARLGEARAELWRPDAELLRSEVRRSVHRLVALRDDPGGHPSTQARCAIALVELATKINDLVDTAPRLAAVEAHVGMYENPSTDA